MTDEKFNPLDYVVALPDREKWLTQLRRDGRATPRQELELSVLWCQRLFAKCTDRRHAAHTKVIDSAMHKRDRRATKTYEH